MLANSTQVRCAGGHVRSNSRNSARQLSITAPAAFLWAALWRQQRIACSATSSGWRHSPSIELPRLWAGESRPKHQNGSGLMRQTKILSAAVGTEATQSPPQPEVQGSVLLHFMPEDITTTAQPGDSIMDAAYAAGVVIFSGCNSGSCGMCEMEVKKYCGGPSDGAPLVVRTCIAAVPPGFHRLEIAQLDDPIWGTDGWDT